MRQKDLIFSTWHFKKYKQYDFTVEFLLLHDGGSYNRETSPLICYTDYWAGFSVLGTILVFL